MSDQQMPSATEVENIDHMTHYLDGVNDMVRAWDEIVAGTSGRTEAFEEFASVIEQLRPQLEGILLPHHQHQESKSLDPGLIKL